MNYNIPKTTDSQQNHSPANYISHRSKKTNTRGNAIQSKLVKQLKGSSSPSPQNFRRHGAQATSVDNLIQYSKQIKSASANAYNYKQMDQQSKIQKQLGALVHAQQKDYFGIAQKLYQLAAQKEPDLNKKIGVRRAQKLSAALSHQGVDEAIADVIKDASSMEDPANLL